MPVQPQDHDHAEDRLGGQDFQVDGARRTPHVAQVNIV
jgi:hypothetical protein